MQPMRSERGDTIIEAVLALAIFAMVTVSMFAIMQRGAASAYNSVERAQVRLLLNEQVELLTFVRDQYAAVKAQGGAVVPGTPADLWVMIGDIIPSSTIPVINACTDMANNPFYLTLNASNAYEVKTTLTAATGLPSAGSGIWIQKVDPSGSLVKHNFHDFYIMACWQSTTGGNQTISSLVRLYEPK